MSLIAALWPAPPLAADESVYDFYTTAAQVIPVIFVALGLELGAQRRDLAETTQGQKILLWWAIYALTLTLVLACGEVVALYVIANDHPFGGSDFIVSVSMSIGAVGIVMPIAIQQIDTVTQLQRLKAQPRGEEKKREKYEVRNMPRFALFTVGLVGTVLAFLLAILFN